MLSIVIPTRNRGLFLHRLLSYCKGQDLQEPILIADSSDENHQSHVKEAVDAVAGHLNIQAKYYDPKLGLAAKLGYIFELVRTDLVVLGADDDFFTIRGLRQAAGFLQQNPEYSLAHGRAVTFELRPGPVYGSRLAVANYSQRSVEKSTAADRLVDHLAHYSTTWYSVHRTAHLRENMRAVAELDMEPVSFSELLPSCLSVIQGKVKKLEVLFAVRQVHIDTERRVPDPFDWIANPSWAGQFSRFKHRVAEELQRHDKIGIDVAQEVVKQAFWAYLSRHLTSKWRARYARRDTAERLQLKKILAQRAPGLVEAWQKGRSFLPGEHNQMLLPSLLRPSSPYHRDFMPIYRALDVCEMETR
jgi:glycosyltransferase domain-containing protein